MSNDDVNFECSELTVIDLRTVPASQTKFSNFSNTDWAVYFIDLFGNSGVEEDKQKALDYARSILTGGQVEILQKTWSDGAISYSFSIINFWTFFIMWK